MFTKRNVRWSLLLAANAVLWCVLGFYQATSAAPQRGQPLANPAAQRADTNRRLAEIAALIKEQNALLRSGKVRVVVDQQP